MDVLKPTTIQIGGRCYRRNATNPPPGWKFSEHVQPYQEDEEIFTSQDNEGDDSEFIDVQETDKGFSLSMEVPSAFYGRIIGKGGETRRRIEDETQCKINIPNRGSRSEVVMIHGSNRNGVISAKTRIDLLVEEARQKQPFTHFLSLPLNTESLQGSFEEFREDVLRQCHGTVDLSEAIFQKPCKLHLTITTLVLLSKMEVMKAKELLQICQKEVVEPILQGERLDVDVRGLECMNDEPGKVRVLYAKVEPRNKTNKLQLIADGLMERFRAAGLARVDYDRVKIHATLMNCAFWKDFDGQGRTSEVTSYFDSRPIMEKFGDYMFGSHTIDSVHISERSSYDANGFYLSAGVINF
ncbi:putative activating signal cointegrator 1 complex subunit 1-like [Apostichopus japonicus]|uniref:Putative activating signal cointegrator 1 complex subunit 1-like n=1 Tax=Stichopus japonicus TaxID=307972 RepID=A0A2G8KU03_STIJA|nr:putative activating signal cointegrator 1 complex subunit 1-like [Apostichopus japonicus]